MAGDEGRLGRLGEVRSCWCPYGIRPTVPKQQVRQYVYAYAAVAPSLLEDDLLNLALCEYKNDESLLAASSSGVFRIFYRDTGRQSFLASVKLSRYP
jgi:hypothetical protein